MADLLDSHRVAVVKEAPCYARKPPYHADRALPEWPGGPVAAVPNPAYNGVRELFRLLGFDRDNEGRENWNPLGAIIAPGNTVVLKPNLVIHRNLGEQLYQLTDTDSLITHGSVIRAVLDYAAKALEGRGRIIIGDCPVQAADWHRLLALSGLNDIERYFHEHFTGIELIIKDYRLSRAIMKGEQIMERVNDNRELVNYLEIDLAERSSLLPLMQNGYRFGVAQYPQWRMRAAHTPHTNRYLMPKELLAADVIINLPKMKSHMKAGISCAMKNFVGLNGHKDYLPHFRCGSPRQGGDEYPDANLLWDMIWYCHHCDWERDGGELKRLFNLAGRSLTKLLKWAGKLDGLEALAAGSWYGNDTVWRTILDINRAFFYFDRKAECLSEQLSPDVRYLAILDGLIGGEKESPLAPTPIQSGMMMAASNPLAMDAVAAALMGYDINKLKQISQAFGLTELPLAHFSAHDIEIISDSLPASIKEIYAQRAYTPFQPSRGYRGHIEYASTAAAVYCRQPEGSS